MVALVAALAMAQAPLPAAEADRQRLRFGIELVSGATDLPTPNSPGPLAVATLFGVGINLGVQLNDEFAILYQGSATLLWPQFTSGALIEWTPFEFISTGVGLSLNWMPYLPEADTPSGHAWGLGVPFRFALNVPLSRTESGQRRAVAFCVTLTPGSTFAVSGLSYSTGFQLGIMGGIGFELY